MQTRRAVIARRALVATAATGALGGLTSALATSDGMQTKQGFLGLMERWNERVQAGLLRPSHLAVTESELDLTPLGEFPAYKISASIPIAPAGWRLKVGGLVARPIELSVAELRRMTRTDVRVRHHCVEGWSAVASWHGVSLRDLSRPRRGGSSRALRRVSLLR